MENQLQDRQGQSVYRFRGIDQRSHRNQPAAGSVGTLPGPVYELWQMVGREALDDGACRQYRRSISSDVQGISAKPGIGNADGRQGGRYDLAWRCRRRQITNRVNATRR